MNRIYIKYTPSQGSVCSSLQIYNDIKGYSCDKIGHKFFGRDADIMLEYFQSPSNEHLHRVATDCAAKCIKLEDKIARIKLICDYALKYEVDLTYALEEISKILEEGKKV